MERRELLLLLSAFGTIVLVGIPQAVNFYPPYVESIVAWLSSLIPANFFVWTERILIALFGVLTGWFLKSVYGLRNLETESKTEIESSKRSNKTAPKEEDSEKEEFESTIVKGCVETDRLVWSGKALVKPHDATPMGRMEPHCPQCRSGVVTASRQGLRNTNDIDKTVKRRFYVAIFRVEAMGLPRV